MSENLERHPEMFYSQRNLIKVCIFHLTQDFPSLGQHDIWLFAHAFPYADQDGGRIIVFNPLIPQPFRYKTYDTTEELYRRFNDIPRSVSKKNPDMKLIYMGNMIGDHNEFRQT